MSVEEEEMMVVAVTRGAESFDAPVAGQSLWRQRAKRLALFSRRMTLLAGPSRGLYGLPAAG